jgi:sigma-B regulation protein RsbU (phosphoserine phosphatase)
MAQYILTGTSGSIPIRFELYPGTLVVGRTRECDIFLSDAAISRRHAEILVRENEVLLRDLDSLNGTFVNGKQLKGKTRLGVRDQVRFGQITLTLTEKMDTPLTRFSPDTVDATLTTTVRAIREKVEESRSERILVALADAGQMLSRRLNLDELLENMLDLLDRFIEASRFMILGSEIVDGRPTVLASRVHDGTPEDPLALSQHMMRFILEEGQSFLTSDAATDDHWTSKRSIVRLGVHAAIGAPLFDNDKILGAVYVDSRIPGRTFEEEDLRLLTLLANMIAVKITNSRLEEEERQLEQLGRELSLASRIQRRLLPQGPPLIEGYQVFNHLETCEDVGGDLYDVRHIDPRHLLLVQGDVTGHGVGAALFMAYVMAGLQFLEELSSNPLELVRQLEHHLEPRVELGHYVTLFAGILDLETGVVTYVNAGHPRPLILKGRDFRSLETTGMPVAILPGDWPRTVAECRLEPGSSLLVFSDGIPETEAGKVQYGEGRMQEFLKAHGGLEAERLGKDLLNDVEEFRGDQAVEDDLTLLVVRRL